MRAIKKNLAFTLIELLIVVAIIAILAAIAVPNFLEAQTRSKVSRSAADMRTIATGIESYRVDHGRTPPPFERISFGQSAPEWWGFTPFRLTTPVAYLTSLPRMVFLDEGISTFWRNWTGTASTEQTFTYVYDPLHMIQDNAELQSTGTYTRSGPPTIPQPFQAEAGHSFVKQVRNASWFLYTSGPDKVDGTVWIFPAEYDPTNGTVSYGDIYRFGTGSLGDSGRSFRRPN